MRPTANGIKLNQYIQPLIGTGVIVFFERDGQALGDDEGHIAMISSMDTRTGPRRMKWLQSIDVRKIVE
jgi:hypothetical protein